MAGPNQTQWAAALLDRLGIPQSKGALQAIVGWTKAEGGHWHNDARFNPLNTTQPARGAGNTGTQGNIKVYRSWNQGLRATVKTLRNGRYGAILKALEAGDPGAVGKAIERSPWGTGGLAAKVIGSTRVGGATKPASALLAAAEGQGGTTSTRSSDNMGGGADPLALLQALGQQAAPRQTAGLQAPAFSAQPAMPAGGMVPQGGMSPAPRPDITKLLASITTPGEGIARTTVEGEATAGGGAAAPVKANGKLLGRPADRPGVATKSGILDFAQQVAGVYGHPIRLGTGTAHNQYTTSGNVSAHWGGNALDLPSVGKKNLAIGRAALVAAGMPSHKAAKANGGIYNVGGYQIIFQTTQGGNHFNHVHIGLRG